MSLLGIDIGTSAVKVAAYGAETGLTLAEARVAYASDRPAPGRMELDPERVWAGFVDAVRSVAAADPVRRDHVTALAFAVSCDEVIPVDAGGRPLGPCIMAPDTRGSDAAAVIGERISPAELYRRSGLSLLAAYPTAKIVWYRMHRPDIARAAASYLGWAEFILKRLGLPALTDETTAGRWLAYDIGARGWMLDFLDSLSIPPSVLPDVIPPAEVIGELPAAASALLGLSGRPIVVAGAFDQICAAVGSGLRAPGEAVVSSGTWENTTILAERPLGQRGLERGATWGPYASSGLDAVLLMNPGGGSVLRWFGDLAPHHMEPPAALVDRIDPVELLLNGVTDEPTDLLFLPHLGGSISPWRDPASKGALIGLSLATTREEVLRALLEGVTFELRLNLEGLATELQVRPPIRNTGGGSRSGAWVQLKADVLGVPIRPVTARETGCLGAAILAGVGSGAYPTVPIAQAQLCRDEPTVDPDPERRRVYDDHFARYRDLYPTLQQSLHAT